MIMRTFIAIIVGIIGGFILGIALSSFIAIFSLSIFNYPFGIKYLPYITQLLSARSLFHLSSIEEHLKTINDSNDH